MNTLQQIYADSLSLLTDLYQLTMAYAYWKNGRAEDEAVFHLTFRSCPFDGQFAIAAGLQYALEYLENLQYRREDLLYLASLRGGDGEPLFEQAFLKYLANLRFTGDADGIPEGTAVFPHEPLLRITAPLLLAQLVETPLLTIVNFQTLLATKAARVCMAAGADSVLEFGLRRAQGIDGGLCASRAAFLGGCHATSNVLAGKQFGIPVRGTHAHSWVMAFDDELEAFQAYASAMPNNAVFLVDTFDTIEGVRKAVQVAGELRQRGHKMLGIRLDSGDLLKLSKASRRILDDAGLHDAAIVASGDLDEYAITELKRDGAPIGVWGIGTKLATAYDQPALGGVYKLSAIRARGEQDWQRRIKLSEQTIKTSDPGILQVRRFSTDGMFVGDVIYDVLIGCPEPAVSMAPRMGERTYTASTSQFEDLLQPLFRRGKRVYDSPSLESSRERAQRQLAQLPDQVRRIERPVVYEVGRERQLQACKEEMIASANDRSAPITRVQAVKLIKTAAAVLNQTPFAWDANQRNIVSAIQDARSQGVTLLCLPELCISGYGCEDAFHAPGVQQTSWQVLQELARETEGMIVSLGLPIMHGGGLFNTACLLANGSILGFVGKQNLAGEGIHYEPRWFKRWPQGVHSSIAMDGVHYPIGDLIFDCGGVSIAFEICEDAWVANRPGADLARQGVDIILNPSASHFAFGKHDVRRRFVLEGSRAFSVSYIYANLLGNEAGRAIYDGDAMIASCGKMLNNGPRFSFADYHVTTAIVDIDMTRMTRARTGSFRPLVGERGEQVVGTEFTYPEIEPERAEIATPPWDDQNERKEEEFTRAVSLALFDYLRKSRSNGFVVSLSGGADSSAVATLCSVLVRLALSELGIEGLRKKLGHLPQLPPTAEPKALVGQLLTCVYQPTRNSSQVTRDAASGLATGIGAEFLELDVDGIVESYVSIVSQAIDRELTWEDDDISLQNIQARARAPSVWLLANLRGALLLSTSNRSEAAVGYATMDGDTAGGLSPIAGIDKAFLRHWLRWMESNGPAGLGPLPCLRAVNVQQPTAELRPQQAKQTDEDDLMPYDVLDVIERAAIRDKLGPLETLLRIEPEFPQHGRRVLAEWVERFFRLWCRNQWKRERYAPSFHLDDENLDPKTWCRFPILSGGYERELRALREVVDQSDGS